MLNCNKFKGVVGIGALLVPTILFGKTSATVNVQKIEAIPSLQQREAVTARMYKGDIVEVIGLAGSSLDEINDQEELTEGNQETEEIQKAEGNQEAKEMQETEEKAEEAIDIQEDKDIWYKVRLESDQIGFVKSEFLTLNEADGTNKAWALNIRSYPDIDHSEIIGKLYENDQVSILYKVGKFYKIYANGSSGFVYAEYIDSPYDEFVQEVDLSDVRDILTGEAKMASGETINSGQQKNGQWGIGSAIVATAMKYLGNAYVYGGTSLTNGTDCSGFTQGVMKLQGINIPRTSKLQSQVGKLVSKSEVQKGDLLFFGKSRSAISHVGIYIGEGNMIHASNSKTGIIIGNAFRGGGTPLQLIRRVY